MIGTPLFSLLLGSNSFPLLELLELDVDQTPLLSIHLDNQSINNSINPPRRIYFNLVLDCLHVYCSH